MFKMLVLAMMINSSIISTISHPLLMSLLIIIQTVILSIFTRLMNSSSWLSMTIFLIMVGGLMIIFMYTTSITSNEIFIKLKIKKYLTLLILWVPLSTQLYNIYYIDSLSIIDNFNMEFYKMFSEINLKSTVFMIYYLLLALLIMIKLINMNKGPMRKKY